MVIKHLDARHAIAEFSTIRLKVMQLNEFIKTPDSDSAVKAC